MPPSQQAEPHSGLCAAAPAAAAAAAAAGPAATSLGPAQANHWGTESWLNSFEGPHAAHISVYELPIMKPVGAETVIF